MNNAAFIGGGRLHRADDGDARGADRLGGAISPKPLIEKSSPAQGRRWSADSWNCLRGAIEREHVSVVRSDPLSPRIKPTLATFRWVR